MESAIYFLGICIVLHALINFNRSYMWFKSKDS